ncbi:MAG TPA: Rrf2 family transcriptional regulator [Anaerolineales bacterium]|jgi:Rrf2 family protein|nr:Rrf2 family transcriptional regulator [Anaerolineales bacterium]
MQITHEADYATRAVLHLARAQKDKLIPTNEIARRQNIPTSFLAKIIAQLSIAGLLHTARGAHGGVKLARKPQNITLLEVIEAIDGPIRIFKCVDGNGNCSCEGDCPIQDVFNNVQDDLVAKLKSTTFAQLMP